jgi:hypothetical protein
VQEASPNDKDDTEGGQNKNGKDLPDGNFCYTRIPIILVVLLIFRGIKVNISILIILSGYDILNEGTNFVRVGLLVVSLVGFIISIIQVPIALGGLLVQVLAKLIDIILVLFVLLDVLVGLIGLTARRTVGIVILGESVLVGFKAHDIVEGDGFANVDRALLIGIDTDADGGLIGTTVRADVVTSVASLLTFKELGNIGSRIFIIVVVVVVVIVLLVLNIADIGIVVARIIIGAAVVVIVAIVIGGLVVLVVVAVVLLISSILLLILALGGVL